jgi:hypothetical protein
MAADRIHQLQDTLLAKKQERQADLGSPAHRQPFLAIGQSELEQENAVLKDMSLSLLLTHPLIVAR